MGFCRYRLHFLFLIGCLNFVAGNILPASAQELLHGQGRFWRLDHNKFKTSYVFGTIHLPDRSVTIIPTEVKLAISKSKYAAFEILEDKVAEAQAGRLMVLQPPQTLRSIIGDRMFAEAGGFANRYGLNTQQINRLKPWALVTIFSLTPEQIAMRQKGVLALDFLLQRKAAASKKVLVGLEDLIGQLNTFDSMSMHHQVLLLRVTLQTGRHQQKMMSAMIQCYLAGDIVALYKMMKWQSDLGGGEFARLFEDRFLNRRNIEMAKTARETMVKGSTFIAVGALHLPGETGLLNLFEKQGYRLRRIDVR